MRKLGVLDNGNVAEYGGKAFTKHSIKQDRQIQPPVTPAAVAERQTQFGLRLTFRCLSTVAEGSQRLLCGVHRVQ